MTKGGKKVRKRLKVFSDPQQFHDFLDYDEVFQMWTSRKQNEVLNIVQAKKYPEVPTFLR